MDTETLEARRARIRAEAQERREIYRIYLKTSVNALEMPLAVVVGFFLGRFIDNRFGTAPWGMWTGVGFGVLTAVRMIYRLILEQRRKHPDDDGDEATRSTGS